MTDAELISWVDRKLSLYVDRSNDERDLATRIMGGLHVVCHRHENMEFYGNEFSRISKERDALLIRIKELEANANAAV